MNHSFARLDIAIAFATLIAQSSIVAAIGEEGEKRSPGVEVTFGGLNVDARQYAIDYNVSQEEALFRLNGQDDLQRELAALKRLAGNRLAGAYIQHSPKFGAVVRVSGTAPISELQSSMKESKFSVTVEYGAEKSFDQLVSLVEAVDWRGISSAVQGVYADGETGEIVLDATADATTSSQLAKALANHTALLGIPWRIDTIDAPFTDSNRGGRVLSTCTSAFTMRTISSGTLGMLTAGHCGNIQSYY